MSDVVFRRLLPDPADVGAAEVAGDLDAGAPAERPRVVLNMVASLDGRIRVDGRSSALGGPGDHALFHALRAAAGAVLVGAGTARAEHYGPVIREPAPGVPVPLACLVTRRLALDPEEIPLLADPGSRVAVLTASDDEVAGAAAEMTYLRCPDASGGVDLAAGLHALRAEHGVASVLCEGGPTLNGALLAAGLVDELSLTLSPRLAGGEDPLSIIGGIGLEEPRRLALRSVHEADGMLFLRYATRPA